MQLNPLTNPIPTTTLGLSRLQRKRIGYFRQTQVSIPTMSEYTSQALDSLPDHIALLDEQGMILSVNKAWRNFADGNGASSGTSIGVGMSYVEVCEKAATNSNDDAIQALAGIKSVLDRKKWNYELEYACHSPSEQRWFSMRVIPLQGPNGGAVVFHTDITRRVEANLIAHESERRFSLIADTAPMMILMFGPNKLATYCNKRFLHFRGRPIEQELGDGWIDPIHSADRDECLRKFTSGFDDRLEFKISYRVRRHDGEYRWIEDSFAPRIDAFGEFLGYIGCAVDITMDKMAQKALQELPGRVIEAQEVERHRIARELHDDIGQKLALLAIDISMLTQLSQKKDFDLAKKAEELIKDVQQISSDLHQVSYQLHPSKLEQLGLVSALKGFFRDIERKHNILIEFSQNTARRKPPLNVALCLYRITQEAIVNAMRHGHAKQVSVELSDEAGSLCLDISDSGVGFDPLNFSNKAGLGLVSMKERVRLLGGEISIHSQPGQGTQITIRLPLASSND